MPASRLLRRPLSIDEILRWASSHRHAMGRWHTKDSGSIAATSCETWLGVDSALRSGTRGLPGGSSLAQLLAQQAGARNIHDLPPLTEELILQWADAHHQRTGSWPTIGSGPILESAGDKWIHVNTVLAK